LQKRNGTDGGEPSRKWTRGYPKENSRSRMHRKKGGRTLQNARIKRKLLVKRTGWRIEVADDHKVRRRQAATRVRALS